jgi:ribonuclease T2
LSADVKAKFFTLYPSSNLFDHEWEKHGTCSGLTPEQYLTLSKHLKDSITIPDSHRAPEQPFRVTAARLKQEFGTANSNLGESSLAVYCSGSGRFLQELYVCYSLEGKPMACSSEIQSKASRSCGSPDFLVQNVR